jgi:Cell division protein CrgA
MAKPTKRRVQGGRSSPKGSAARPPARASRGTTAPETTGRYTPPTPHAVRESPPWVPVLMFVLLGVGTLLILLNYVSILWDTSNWVLVGGLVLILLGIVVATQYR